MIDGTEKYFLRNEIGSYMETLGNINDKVVAVTADLVATCRYNGFVEKFPERSFNMGIAEQNMISFSAGLAHEGFMPFAFSMAPFIAMRACEQCRTDVAYGRLNVRLMATYAGCSGGISGATHWAVEDCAIMTGIPEMTVVELSDPMQTKKLLEQSLKHKGPIYFRSTVEPVEKIYSDEACFEIGKASIPVAGKDGAIICSGVVVQYAVKAAQIIKQKTGINIRVVDMHTIKPIDKTAVINAAKTGSILVAQDHNIIGGLGSMVASVIAENSISTKFKVLGLRDEFLPMAHAPYLYKKFEIDIDGLVKNMIEMKTRLFTPPPHRQISSVCKPIYHAHSLAAA